MKSSKLVCRAAIFVQTVSFMHKFRMEMRQPTVSACQLLWIRWEKLKMIKLKILVYFSWMCCVVTEFVYADTIILFNLGEYWLLKYSPSCFACWWIFCHYSPRFQRIIVKCGTKYHHYAKTGTTTQPHKLGRVLGGLEFSVLNGELNILWRQLIIT